LTHKHTKREKEVAAEEMFQRGLVMFPPNPIFNGIGSKAWVEDLSDDGVWFSIRSEI
jgi:hypothetical protein